VQWLHRSLLSPLLLARPACIHGGEGCGLDKAALRGWFMLCEIGITESKGSLVEGARGV